MGGERTPHYMLKLKLSDSFRVRNGSLRDIPCIRPDRRPLQRAARPRPGGVELTTPRRVHLYQRLFPQWLARFASLGHR